VAFGDQNSADGQPAIAQGQGSNAIGDGTIALELSEAGVQDLASNRLLVIKAAWASTLSGTPSLLIAFHREPT
jgi:hypothetical protein